MNMEILSEFVEIENQLADLKAKTKKLAERKAAISPQVIEILIQNQISRITVNNRTIYIHNRTVAKLLTDKTEVIQMLKASQFQDYIDETYNANSLNSLVSEMKKSDDGLPEEFKNYITTTTITTPRSIKS